VYIICLCDNVCLFFFSLFLMYIICVCDVLSFFKKNSCTMSVSVVAAQHYGIQ